jgi:hypothetical protein
MLRLKSFPFPRGIIAILILVGVILPSLHFHPSYEHDHQEDMAHSHGVVHADFLSVLGHDHTENTVDHNVRVSDIESPWATDQINFVTLASHKVEPKASQRYSVFLFYEERENPTQVLFHQGFVKPDHPPPITEFYTGLRSSRSPPPSA